MNPIDSIGMMLLFIPQDDFVSWPADRSFRLLAEDSRALRRRALKGIGVEIQRGLFVQLARRLDGLALEAGSKSNGKGIQTSLVLQGVEAEAWLELDEVLGQEDMLLLTSPINLRETWLQRIRRCLKRWLKALLLAPIRLFRSKEEEILCTPLVGEQVLFPGEEVALWRTALKSLNSEMICEFSAAWGLLGSDGARSLLKRASTFFEMAHKNNGAVVQVLFDMPIS